MPQQGVKTQAVRALRLWHRKDDPPAMSQIQNEQESGCLLYTSKEALLELNGRTLRIGVVSGLGNADDLIEKIKSGEEHFDFVEVMACPYGCIAGAGQPFCHKVDKKERIDGMYRSDKAAPIKRSEENPVIYTLYNNGGLLEGREHELLHEMCIRDRYSSVTGRNRISPCAMPNHSPEKSSAHLP